MKNITKIAGAIAMAGVVAAGSSAFTAGGLAKANGLNGDFIGGQIRQTVSAGSTLNSIAYGFFDAEADVLEVNSVALVFAGDELVGRRVTAYLNHAANTETFTCTLPLSDGEVVPTTSVTCTGDKTELDTIDIRVTLAP